MKPTKKQCAEIARATKHICNFSGFSHIVAVWHDFSWEEAVDANGAVGRTSEGGQIERPLILFREPASAQSVSANVCAAIAMEQAIRAEALEVSE